MNVLSRIVAYAPEKKRNVAISIILSILATFLIVLPFYFFRKILQSLIIEGNMKDALFYAGVVVGLMVLRVIIYLCSVMTSHYLAFRVETNMKKKGLEKLLNASFSFFDVNQSGQIRKIIDDNTEQTHTVVAHLIPDMAASIILPILLIAIMFIVNIKLGILIIAITIIAGIIIMQMYGDRTLMKTYMLEIEKMNAETVEYVRGIQVIKIFNTGIESFNTLFNLIQSSAMYAYKYTLSCRLPFVIFQVIFMMFTALTVPFATNYLQKGANPQEILVNVIFFALFAGIMFGCFMKVMFLGMYSQQGNNAVTKLEELFEEMDRKKVIHGTETQMTSTDIEFVNVSFGYEKDQEILKDLSFKLEGGKTYALVGSSGGGKSTIAKLISGFYSLDSGKIMIGGKNLIDYSHEALMKHIAFVFQNAKLFKTSIFENVQIGNPSASYDEVMAALKAARCDDILNKFDSRENTVIGSKGVHLSGGEIQRISIARAILKNADIIILDEASAAADPENEYEIQQAFTNLMKGKTVIMIAHRLSSIRNVDEILVVDNGTIIERGSDSELMKNNGRYKKLQDLFSQANDWRIQ